MSVIPNEPCYLGIDLGTSATKAVVLTADGTVLARCRVTHPTARTAQPGRADPTAWRDSIAAACGQLGEIAQHVQAVGIDTHCPCALLLDHNGKPLTRGLSWDHPGMAAPTAELIELTTAAHRRLIGNRLAPATAMAAAYRLFCELEPDAVSKASTFGLVGTWLGQWLTGKRAIDPTQASYTGAMATTEGGGRWLTDLLEAFDVPVGLLPPVRSSLDVLGPLLPSAARELGLPAGVPVLVGSADTPAASYALDVKPGGRPLFIMGTTHVISNCLDAPDLRSQALQRADVRPGQWLINGVINGGDALALGAKMLGYGLGDVAVAGMIGIAGRATPQDMTGAPVFIPHVRAERGPLWFAEPRTALLGLLTDTSSLAAARGVVEGVLFADRMIIESCISKHQRTLCVSGAFGADPELPQMLADALDREIQVIDESHLPAIGAAGMCAEGLHGKRIPPPPARSVKPRPDWRDATEQRWQQYRQVWTAVTGMEPLATLDEPAEMTASAVHRVGCTCDACSSSAFGASVGRGVSRGAARTLQESRQS
jgi:xylulokinase